MKLLDHVYFNESYFPAAPSRAHEYSKRMTLGYDRMGESSVVIAGLARSVARILPATRLRMEQLGRTFARYQILIYENDSQDQTLTLLQDWAAANSQVEILSESLGAPISLPIRCANRADRMAYYRNRCQERIRDRHADADYVILVDTDVEGGWSPDGVASTFGYDDWDFVGSNGVIFKRRAWRANALAHYDAWAYRENDAFEPLSTKYVNRISFTRGEPLVPLASCFGGLGVYRMGAYLAGTYRGGDIEHVSLHRSMREQGFDRTFLNPSQIVLYGRKHRRLDPWVKRIQRLGQSLWIHRRIPWRFEHSIDFQQLGILSSERSPAAYGSAVCSTAA